MAKYIYLIYGEWEDRRWGVRASLDCDRASALTNRLTEQLVQIGERVDIISGKQLSRGEKQEAIREAVFEILEDPVACRNYWDVWDELAYFLEEVQLI